MLFLLVILNFSLLPLCYPQLAAASMERAASALVRVWRYPPQSTILVTHVSFLFLHHPHTPIARLLVYALTRFHLSSTLFLFSPSTHTFLSSLVLLQLLPCSSSKVTHLCIFPLEDLSNMARGNQRDLARQRNLKKQQEAAKSSKKTGDPKKRMENDADILRQKQAAADARKEAERLANLKKK